MGHNAPIRTPLGAIVLLALLRWRRPEARLLLAMACVPQVLLFADQLPLALVARSRREMFFYVAWSLTAWQAWALWAMHKPYYLEHAAPYVLFGCYLPALLLIVRRSNEGALPAWMERFLVRLLACVSPGRVLK
jgi:hypothetical protein